MRKDQRIWQFISLEVGLLLVYFATRLFHLTLLPMFVDEATYMLWALKMGDEGSFVGSSEASKLTIWVMSLVLPFFVGNLLWAGRFISVIVGMLGLIGCYLLGRRLFNRRVGLIGAVVYLVVPYTFFYDRLAIMDGLLTTLVIYLILISLQFTHQPNLKNSVALGVILMLLILAKFNGFVYGVLPLLWMLITYRSQPKRGLAWAWIFLAYSLGALGFIPSIINSSYWGRAWGKLGAASRPDRPFWWNWLPNLTNSLDTLVQNLSLPIFMIACLGLALVLIQHRRYGFLVLGCISVTLVPFVLAPKPWAWYPRYLLPVAPFLILITAYTISQGINRLKPYLNIRNWGWRYGVMAGLVLVIIGPALRFDYWLLTDPSQAPFVELDRWQHIESKYAGYALAEAANYLRSQVSPSEHVVVVYPRSPYSISDILQVYLYDQQQYIAHIKVDFATVDPDLLTQRLLTQSAPVFIVTSDDKPPEEPMTSKIDFDTFPYIQRVAHFDRPGGVTGVNIYKKKE